MEALRPRFLPKSFGFGGSSGLGFSFLLAITMSEGGGTMSSMDLTPGTHDRRCAGTSGSEPVSMGAAGVEEVGCSEVDIASEASLEMASGLGDMSSSELDMFLSLERIFGLYLSAADACCRVTGMVEVWC